ncbi:hypothetical protein OBBRIDRAFT_813253 [Obba rivulosa]|uniref:DUF7704 domain-containing protein n=1 Tax=Obba rivulosa TaxID=1052685 RepID=A0A8E2AWC4_9APHY|nr:hypothetical protein OBBRIDRAFT_813253 [Obba rivulosa]
MLPELYQLLSLYIEPISTVLTMLLIWFSPGAALFHRTLILRLKGAASMDVHSVMAMWQLGNCYLLLSLILTLVFRARKFIALVIADSDSIMWTFIGLPESLWCDLLWWNSMVHGNIMFVIMLLSGRLAWFAGIGHTKYAHRAQTVKEKPQCMH